MSNIRYVVDESTLVPLSGVQSPSFESDFFSFVNQIFLARKRAEGVGISDRGVQLYYSMLGECNKSNIDRDLWSLAWQMLDRCTSLHCDHSVSSCSADVDDVYTESCGMVEACRLTKQGSFVGVLMLGRHCCEVVNVVPCDGASYRLPLVWDDVSRKKFYQKAICEEVESEGVFFERAGWAFPRIRFASEVSFRKFEGRFADLLPEVVRHLSVIEQDFLSEYRNTQGNAKELSARLEIDVTMESVKTRGSEKLMKMRDVTYNGRTYRCEWHSKIEPHRNRIHLAVMDDDCILVGMFVKHLDT